MGKKAGKIALGLGLVTGAITGLLFAPEEGKKMRDKIRQGDTKGLVKDLANMGEDLKGMVVEIAKNPSVLEALDSAKDSIAETAHMKRAELDAMLEKANMKADKFKKMVAQYVKEQKAVLDEKMATRSKSSVKKKSPAKKPTAKKTQTKKTAPAKSPVKKTSKAKKK